MEPGYRGNKKRGRVKRLFHHLFPERQLFLRAEGRLSHLRFSCRMQVVVALIVMGAGAWAAFSTASYVLHDDVLASKDNQIANVRLEYRSLLNQLAAYQTKFTNIAGELKQYHETMLGLAEHNTTLQQNLNTVETKLRSTQSERENVIAAREGLKGRLGELENDMAQLANRNFSLKDNLTSIEQDLETTVSERNHALFEKARMHRQINDLETRLSALQAAEHDVVQRLTEQTVASLDDFAKVVEIAGLDVADLLKADGTPAEAQGGPFINISEAKAKGMPADALRVSLTNLDVQLNQLEGLQSVLRKLPLSSPLDYFQITSRHGKRRDPFNRRWAMHYGIDMGGVYKSSVYSTAPGVVTFAGWKGNYGRMVEISHGAGVKTRFGHLYRTVVKKGQKIKFREKVGLLGNSGRSTGAHLHYEIIYKGRSRDPMKFMKAGRYVFQE